MTIQELNNILDEIKLPYTYYFFPENDKNNPVPNLPYFVYYFPNNDGFGADNINFANVNALNIELYTAYKNYDVEAQLEAILTKHGFYFSKTETYLESERMYEVLYEMEVLIKYGEQS